MNTYIVRIEELSSSRHILALFTAITAEFDELDFSFNFAAFDTFPQEIFYQAFACIGLSITTINLSFNSFGTKPLYFLANILAALPEHLHTINLSFNNLYQFSPFHLAVLFSTLPKQLTNKERLTLRN